MMQITKHARARMQQRGIQQETVEILMKYGEGIHCKGSGNTEIVFLSRKARRYAQGSQPDLWRIIKSRFPYLVIAENSDVITAGHRTKRIRRH